jgi:hypothetical protein
VVSADSLLGASWFFSAMEPRYMCHHHTAMDSCRLDRTARAEANQQAAQVYGA